MRLVAAIGCALAAHSAHPADPRPTSVSLEGTVLRATLADGTVLAGRQLAGRHLLLPAGDRTLELRIGAVEEDSASPGLVLYELLIPLPGGESANICEADREGRRWAIPLSGHLGEDGRFDFDPGRLTLACTSGVLGKCLRAGYRFWTPGASVDREGLDRFRACTRMYRADYCGDGQGWTSDGVLIDVYDDRRIQSPEPDTALAFEAGWSPRGAVCVHHTRVPENIGLDDLPRRCPRLAQAPLGPHCTEERARGLGAILFNKSRAPP